MKSEYAMHTISPETMLEYIRTLAGVLFGDLLQPDLPFGRNYQVSNIM